MNFSTVIVGAGGFLGHRLCLAASAEAARKGLPTSSVAGLSLHRPLRQQGGVHRITGDRRRPEVVDQLLATEPARWIDTAIFDAMDATLLVQAARRALDSGLRLPRFIITSTIGEHAQIMAQGGTIDPDSPTGADDEHAAGKLEAFRVFSDNPWLDTVWALLPMMWGPGDHDGSGPGGRTRLAIRNILEGRKIVFEGSFENSIPDGFVDTVAGALLFIPTGTGASGITRMPVAGPESLTPGGFLREAATEAGLDAIIESVGLADDSDRQKIFPGSDVTMDCRTLYQSGFIPAHDWRSGVRETVRAELIESGRAWGCQR